LLLTSSTFLTAAATQARLPYDPIAAFTPVAMVGEGPLLLAVSASTPFKSPEDLLAAARAKPDALTYGTAGVGSIGHLATVLLSDAAKVKLTHVPYKGAANAAQEMGGGQIDAMISNYSTLAPLMQKEGGQGARARRHLETAAPVVRCPAAARGGGSGYDMDIWIGVFAPAGTPAAVVERLNREINAIAASPELAVLLGPDGTLPTAMSPSAFAARVKDELAKWKQLAAAHKIVTE
jgi:tripartite-type tricarboxylate transporter receptor subunit TctC